MISSDFLVWNLIYNIILYIKSHNETLTHLYHPVNITKAIGKIMDFFFLVLLYGNIFSLKAFITIGKSEVKISITRELNLDKCKALRPFLIYLEIEGTRKLWKLPQVLNKSKEWELLINLWWYKSNYLSTTLVRILI